MPAVELVEPGLCGTSYDIESPSQSLMSTINTSDALHEHAEVDKNDVPIMKTFASKERYPLVSADSTYDRWCVSINNEIQICKVKTQKGVRSAILLLSSHCKADRHFNRLTLKGKWCTDYMFGRTKSLDDNVGAQVLANK